MLTESREELKESTSDERNKQEKERASRNEMMRSGEPILCRDGV